MFESIKTYIENLHKNKKISDEAYIGILMDIGTLDLETNKIPEICDQVQIWSNCEWKDKKDYYFGDTYEKLEFCKFKECPKICPRYKGEK